MKHQTMYSVVALVAVTICAAPAQASVDHDSTAIVATIDRFHAALATGDPADVKTLLSSDVIVLESGSLETRADYLSHHLAADIEFAKAIRSDRKVVKVVRNGNTAWVTATSTTKGDFKGRAINSRGAELMVLTKTRGAWRIRAIHWSSARVTG